MADQTKFPPPESPTTARPLDLSDDEPPSPISSATAHLDNTAVSPLSDAGREPAEAPFPSLKPVSPTAMGSPTNEAAPAQPPRPQTEAQKNEALLKEAFPTVEGPVIKAVLVASGGNVDRAFHALLQMTDPSAVENEQPPAAEQPRGEAGAPVQPPRPSGLRQYMTQLEADELYARELAAKYERRAHQQEQTRNGGSSAGGFGGLSSPKKDKFSTPNEDFNNFIEEDLPQIKENLKKGFLETQTKVNSWISVMKKKLDEALDENDGESSHQAHGMAYGKRPGSSNNRRSGDYERYDADPHVITDDFAGMKLAADGTPIRESSLRSPSSQTSGVFRPPPPQKSPNPRKVAFREEIDEIEPFSPTSTSGNGGRGPATSVNTAVAGKTSKWQPLSPAELTPVGENDPFTLGDSDDEGDHHGHGEKKEAHGGIQMVDGDDKNGKSDGEERVRKAAAEAMEDSLVEDGGVRRV